MNCLLFYLFSLLNFQFDTEYYVYAINLGLCKVLFWLNDAPLFFLLLIVLFFLRDWLVFI